MWAKALPCPGTNLVTRLYHGLAQVFPAISVPQLLLLAWSSTDPFAPICGDKGCLKSILWPEEASSNPKSNLCPGYRGCEPQASWLAGEALPGCFLSLVYTSLGFTSVAVMLALSPCTNIQQHQGCELSPSNDLTSALPDLL